MSEKISEQHIHFYEEYLEALKSHAKANEDIKQMNITHEKLLESLKAAENDVEALQSVGQLIGEVLKKLTNDTFIVKTSQGPRYVVGCKASVEKEKINDGTRVSLDLTTLTIMKILPKEVDPFVFSMSEESPGNINFEKIGGLKNQIRELREVIELPLKNPEIFKRVGIVAPKGVLLYGPPGTGKTLLARAVANTLDVNFLKVVSSALIEKYIGESSRMIREMFSYARTKAPCIIFLDEIDAIGAKRTSESSSSDREVQRTLMELLNQMDGFKDLDDVKIIMATNRPDILDPALLRPGRLDRKIEIPLPNDQGRKEILKIHTQEMNKEELDFDVLCKLTDKFNGADLRNVCTEAGMFALREERDYTVQEDFVKACRKILSTKKLESKMDYKRKE
ncbi:hypothetical protein H312_01822 [Anncaliia algerae PRA339]|uniref:AAA+ ATPase domain-containing protein n=1 Tax=Anncaliia algerae PRA339 TaxID=1288291 RepID=A0A059F184_9MICR|nr:hypothetical protein H312_01822 [Anncaliia algerae PRA339]